MERRTAKRAAGPTVMALDGTFLEVVVGWVAAVVGLGATAVVAAASAVVTGTGTDPEPEQPDEGVSV